MCYYFSNHVHSHNNSYNSLFSFNKQDTLNRNNKRHMYSDPDSIVCNSNIIPNRKNVNNTNNCLPTKKTHMKNCCAETDSDTNTDDNNSAYNGININNTNINGLKDKIFSPGDYQEQDDLLILNKNNNADSELNITVPISQNKFTSSRNPLNVTTLSLMKGKPLSSYKKTLILDLDETLVHSSFQPIYRNADLQINIQFDKQHHIVYVFKRPFVDKFLLEMSKVFNIVIFTASVPEYANPLLDKLDIYKVISKRYFRRDCTERNGLFIKELRKVGCNLKDMIILDNNPISYSLNRDNGFPIRTWHFDKTDRELYKIIPYLNYLSKVDDVRKILSQVVIGGSIDETYFDLLMRQSSKYVNKEIKTEGIISFNRNICENKLNNDNKQLNKSKSISSIRYKQNEEHSIKVNKLKEEILNSINAINPKSENDSHENSVIEFNNSLISSNYTTHNETHSKNNNHYLRKANSTLNINSNSNLSTLNYNSDNAHSIINKPNYINLSRLSQEPLTQHYNNKSSSLRVDLFKEKSCFLNKKDSQYSPSHSHLIHNNLKFVGRYKTPSVSSNPNFGISNGNIHNNFLYRFATNVI